MAGLCWAARPWKRPLDGRSSIEADTVNVTGKQGADIQAAPVPNMMPCPKLRATATVSVMIVGSRVSRSLNIGNAKAIENRQAAMNNVLRP